MNTFFTAPYNASTRTHYLKALNTHYLSWGKLQSPAQHELVSPKSHIESIPGSKMKMKTTKLHPYQQASNNSNQDG